MPRGNMDNLVPNSERTPEERRANARKAGRASGVKRKAAKTFRETIKAILEGRVDKRSPFYQQAKDQLTFFGIKGDPTGIDLVNLGVFKRAMKGDTNAATFLRDTVGEKPADTFVDETPPPPVVLGLFNPERSGALLAQQAEERAKDAAELLDGQTDAEDGGSATEPSVGGNAEA